MRKLILSLAATPLILGSIAVSAQAADDAAVKADSGFNVFSDVKFKGELRTRYEYVDIDALSSKSTNPLDPANIATNRTNLNFSAKLFEVDGLNTEMELNAVNDFGTQTTKDSQINQNLAQKSNGAGEVAVAKISQANISYTNSGATGLVGRKTVNLDNQRWVGSVGWKQNFQTLDLALLSYGIGDFSILGAYVYGVNAIGDDGYDHARGEVYNGVVGSGSTTSGVIHAAYKVMDPLTITGYGYLLGSVSDTYGLAATGKIGITDGIKLDYRAEYAMQTKASLEHTQLQPKSNTDKVSAQYINVDVGANISGVLVGVNYEVLGANTDYDRTDATNSKLGALQTHLATKHKFNGWADMFLKTPDGGLQDINGRIGYKSKSLGKVLAVYHMFSATQDMDNKDNAADAATNLGSEIDLLYTRAIPGAPGLKGLVKAAMYSAGDVAGYGSNKTMVWAQLDYKFATK